MRRSARACKCGGGKQDDTNKQRAHGLRLLIKGNGVRARDREASLTALVAWIIAWADGRRRPPRRLGLRAGTSVTACGLGFLSGQSGERGYDRKIMGNHLLSLPAKVGGLYLWGNSDTRGTSKLWKQKEEQKV